MKRIGFVVKHALPRAMLVADELRLWLAERNIDVFVEEGRMGPELRTGEAESSALPKDIDLVVVLGGDGTLLYAARTLGRNGIPLLGINMGGLGFLTELCLENLYPAMEQILAGDYQAEKRMMLAVEVERNGEIVTRQHVLNDAVIHKEALARILDLNVKIDQMPLTNYRADGLIICTPTGSTAYNLSAGGPIVHPAQEMILLTPICPFTLTNRPLILPRESLVEVEVHPEASDVILTADGQISCSLEPGDKVYVRRSDSHISLITNPYKNYFEILRTKLRWG